MSLDFDQVIPISKSLSPKRQQAKRHYGVHPYFTRRSWHVVQEYIKTFTKPGDVVLDPFGGSGVTAVEALCLGRKAVQVDINPLSGFITKQIAVSPVNITKLTDCFHSVKSQCSDAILNLYHMSEDEIEKLPIPFWYPKSVPLPHNADVDFVDQLFTRRSLIALSILRHHISELADHAMQDLLMLSFSATIAKVNRTFVSAKGRAESRGGSTIFSIYRYYIPKNPVELNVWEQFEKRFKNVLVAKKETNQVISDNYSEHNCQIITESATKLTQFLTPESVDYIFTDPPYGAHISYLDLSIMWTAWLNQEVSQEQKELEAIEGGDLGKTKQGYMDLLASSLDEMFKVLKKNSWLSVVFAHKDPSYWDILVKSAQKSGFEYVNTAVQPLDVVWSMHKKKNPLHVLSGELILNFRKVDNPKTIAIMALGSSVFQIIKNSSELTIVKNHGATTESIYHDLIPKLLEAGLLGEVKKTISDITPLLGEEFDFSSVDNQWHIRPNAKLGHFIPLQDRIRFYVTDYLIKCGKSGKQATFEDIVFNVMPNLVNGEQPTKDSILEVLTKIGYSKDGSHWVLSTGNDQLQLELTYAPNVVPNLPVPQATMEHNEVIYRLAKMGSAASLLIHLGKKEQSASCNNEKLGNLSIKIIPYPANTKKFTQGKIDQIDCIWFDSNLNPVYAFEVEGSTPITTGIDRFIELLKVAPEIGKEKHLTLVIPKYRQKEIDKILSESHYIGHPFYLETKLTYLFYEELLKVYNSLVSQMPTAEHIIGKIDSVRGFPVIKH